MYACAFLCASAAGGVRLLCCLLNYSALPQNSMLKGIRISIFTDVYPTVQSALTASSIASRSQYVGLIVNRLGGLSTSSITAWTALLSALAVLVVRLVPLYMYIQRRRHCHGVTCTGAAYIFVHALHMHKTQLASLQKPKSQMSVFLLCSRSRSFRIYTCTCSR